MAYEYGMGMATAWRESSRAGDHWLARNAEAIAQLPSPKIIRWNYCILDSRFDPALERLEELAEADLAFQTALRSTTEAFWQRNAGRAGECSRERYGAFLEASTAFLLEELAVFTFLCRPPGIDVYAGSWLTSIFEALRQQDEPLFEAFRQDWLQVDFTRNKGYREDTRRTA